MKQLLIVFILSTRISFAQNKTGNTNLGLPNSTRMLKAGNDNEFDKGSKMTLKELRKIPENELADLGKIWGFLKYHHPAIASGTYNWDYELFRILSRFENTTSPKERQTLLLEWTDGLGSFQQRKDTEEQSREIALHPDLKWITSSVFSENLKKKLLAIKDAERSGEHYYVGKTPNDNPDFKNENSYESMLYPDAGFRLLGLFRYWNMIQYYFPYRNLIDENWNETLLEFIPVFLNAQDEIQYRLAAIKLIARISDTHADISGDPILEKHFGERTAAINVTFIENQAVVTGYHKTMLGEKSGLKKGDVLEKINGKPVSTIVGESRPFTPASNYPTQLRKIATKILRTNDSIMVVNYKRGQQSGQVTIKSYDLKNMPAERKFQRKDTCFRLIRPDISYLYPGSIKNRYLPKITPEILKTKGLIIDLRCYPSDLLVHTLGNTLLPAPRDFAKYSVPKVNEPGLFEYDNPVRTGEENSEYFKGQVVILVNELTQSSAEYTAMAFRTAPKVKVIGSTTAGADGDTSPIFLPGNIMTHISGLGVFYPDGRGTQRVGIIPDIQISPTIQGIAEGRDELIEKAIEIIDEK